MGGTSLRGHGRAPSATDERGPVSSSLRGRGKGFCAGADIKELAHVTPGLITKVNAGCYEHVRRHSRLPRAGGGRDATDTCSAAGIGASPAPATSSFASEDATFGLPEIDRGSAGCQPRTCCGLFPIQKVRKHAVQRRVHQCAREAYRLGAAGVRSALAKSCFRPRAPPDRETPIAVEEPQSHSARQGVA